MHDHGQADILSLAESVYHGVVADPEAFAPRALNLVERARREGEVEALVVALRAQAWADRLSQRNASALALLDEASVLAARHGFDRRLAEVLVSRIAVQQELGHLTEAQYDADRAAALLPTGERAEMLFQQGVLFQNTGHLEAAGRLYRQVLADTACPAVVMAKAGNNLAHLECELGHPDLAIALLESAAKVADEVGPTVRAYVAQTRAWVEVQRGRLAESLARFETAHALYEAAGLPLGGHYLEYSDALAGLWLLPEALEAAQRGVRALPEGEVSLMAAEAQLRVARLSLLAGDLEPAQVAADRSLALLDVQGRPGWLARAVVVSRAIQARERSLTTDELQGLRQGAADLESYGMRSDAVDACLLAGRLTAGPAGEASLRSAERLAGGGPVLVRLRGRLAAALRAEAPAQVLSACRAGLADLDRHRRALPSTELRVLASAHGAELGVLGLRALRGSAASAARVFDWLERTRVAALAPLEALPDEGAEPELVALRPLHAELSAVQDDAVLLSRVRQAEEDVRRASWSAAAPGVDDGPRPAPSAAQVRQQLGDAVLVEYGVLDGRLLAVVLDRRRTRLVELGPVDGLAATIDGLLFALRRLSRPVALSVAVAAAGRSATAALAALEQRLVSPLALDPQAALIVVPVGDLQRVPWTPLHPGPTTVVPSARVWLRTREQPSPSERVVLVAGPDLPGAAAEVAALHSLHPTAIVLPAATCDAAVEALRDASLAHFACHGRLRTDNPAFSALRLADGPLTVHELSRQQRAPSRVILAACESGAQVGFPGDEALGFVSVLLARGSAGVLASGLLVPDEQALALMVGVHDSLSRGRTLGSALWEARQSFDPDDPAELLTRCAFDAYGAA